MLFLRIRQAECALQAGRLDEAFDLACRPDVRAHHRGGVLAGQLVQALLGRGREHLQAGRFTEALADAGKAERLGGNLPEAAALKTDVAAAMATQRLSERRRAEVLAAAREQIDLGHLSVGQRLLEELDPERASADRLRRELELRRGSAERALEDARAAMEREDVPAAVEALLAARQAKGHDAQVAELAASLARSVCGQAREALEAGRVDQAALRLEPLARLAGEDPQVRELQGFVDRCRQAWGCLDGGDARQAEMILRRLATTLPRAKWLRESADAARQAAEAVEGLRGGPLGLLAEANAAPAAPAVREPSAPRPATPPIRVAPNAPRMGTPDANGALPRRFVLQIDGVGSCLVHRDPHVTVGPISSSRRPEIALMAEAGTPIVSIDRSDEEYLLHAEREVRVNDRPCTQRLLTDGDAVALSPRCRLRFQRPNAASSSAVLALSGTRLGHADVRTVVLLDRELIVGPGATAHLRADALEQPVVFQVRGGGLVCHTHPVAVGRDGAGTGESQAIPLGRPVRVGPLSLVVTPA